MSEKTKYNIFRKNVLNVKQCDRIDRIENVVLAGMPDVNYCFEGVEGWIEMKAPTEPKRASTPLFGSNHKLSQEQKNWFKRQDNAQGRGYILIATDKRWILMMGSKADYINEMPVNELVKESRWSMLNNQKNWELLRWILAAL